MYMKLHGHFSNLHCVVVVCGGGSCIYIYIYIYIYTVQVTINYSNLK